MLPRFFATFHFALNDNKRKQVKKEYTSKTKKQASTYEAKAPHYMYSR